MSDINESLFQQHLVTQDEPPVDLLIRTSGEQRISNFLLWQIAYAELCFLDVLWPDFSEKILISNCLLSTTSSPFWRDRISGELMLKERVLSAIVLIALVLCALFLFTPFYFALALGFVATLGIWEWAQFARFKNPLARLCIAAFFRRIYLPLAL